MADLLPKAAEALKWLDSDGPKVLGSFRIYPPDADDILQDARLALVRKQHEWNLDEWRPLIYAVLVNGAMRFKKRKPLESLDSTVVAETVAETRDICANEEELLSHETVRAVLDMVLDFMPGGDAAAVRRTQKEPKKTKASDRARKSRFWKNAKNRLTSDDVSVLTAIQMHLARLVPPESPSPDDLGLQRAIKAFFTGRLEPHGFLDAVTALRRDNAEDESADSFRHSSNPQAGLALAIKGLRVRGPQGEIVHGLCNMLMFAGASDPQEELTRLEYAMFSFEDGFQRSKSSCEYTATIAHLFFMFCVLLTVQACVYGDLEDGMDDRVDRLLGRAEKMGRVSETFAVVHYAARLQVMLMAGAIPEAWTFLRDEANRTHLMVGFLRPSGWQVMDAITDRQ